MIRNIVFDLGGVLIHLNRGECVRRFKAIGVAHIEEMLDPYLQKGLFLDLESGRKSEEEFRAELSRHIGKELTYQEVYDALLGFLEEISAEKFDYIDSLCPDYRLFLLSNTNPYVLDLAMSPCFLPSGRTLDSFFDKVYASCRMGKCKPNEDIFLEMIADSGMNPEETLFIDDGPANVATAERLGFHTYCPDNGENWIPTITRLLHEQK
ncbi:haloacid dehalogenase [Porphyromonas gulae]|uniref:Haloacid dehalogenase n=1 Tax=Porphyromonas gulae TaxID=111105 RepID=A0A0A2F182_9PORP|nr:HAD family phosphatase [Porphyromonas gulae]KGN79649.1 haloacid dehalogenase [Porphyromonas gulae]KGN84768.1 haloacid dehalogenase [Porphyromonas gulae]KGN85512.1 haloacid dehalogenase [Porphyromonas gulae]